LMRKEIGDRGDGVNRGVVEVALAKSGEFSMVSLARGWFTQGCAASDGRGFTLGSAERALQARRHGSPKGGTRRGRRRASRTAGPERGFWLIVAYA
jgi:hypothetical protein